MFEGVKMLSVPFAIISILRQNVRTIRGLLGFS